MFIMRHFLGAASISRTDLLKGKARTLQNLINKFMTHPKIRFGTEYGQQKIRELLASYDIKNTDESVVSFAELVEGEHIGIICYQVGSDDYDFQLVSGSKEELRRMMKD